MTFYVVLTGQHPFESAEQLFDLVSKVKKQEIDFGLIKNEQARDCISRMLDKNASTRATIKQLLNMDWVV